MFNITHAIASQDKSETPIPYNISIKVFNLLTLPRFHSETHIRITPMRYQTIKNVTIFLFLPFYFDGCKSSIVGMVFRLFFGIIYPTAVCLVISHVAIYIYPPLVLFGSKKEVIF